MNDDDLHGDLLVRAQNVLLRARTIVDKQEAFILRLRAQGTETRDAETVLETYRETLRLFQRTHEIIASKRLASEDDVEALLHLLKHLLPQ